MKKTHLLVMLPTEKSNITLGIGNNNTKDKLHFSTIPFDKGKNNQPQHLYILSDEEIKEGDWFINCNNYVQQATENNIKSLKNNEKKIVATTDKSLKIEGKCWCMKPERGGCLECNKQLPQFHESFIQAYIKAYNEGKPITEVDLEIIDTTKGFNPAYTNWKIKTRLDNTVIIHKSKMYSKEEVESLLFSLAEHYAITSTKNEIEDFNKWIKDNL